MTCCNYFLLNGQCVEKCPENSYPDENFECVCNKYYNFNGYACLVDKTSELNPGVLLIIFVMKGEQ